MTADTRMVAVDGTDALAYVIIRPGTGPQDVAIEAAAHGIDREQAAYVLRHVADMWDPQPAEQPADDEWARCAALHCPNAERFAKAVERGWAPAHMGTWLCPQHRPATPEQPAEPDLWQRLTDALNAVSTRFDGMTVELDGHITTLTGERHIIWSPSTQTWRLDD